MGAAAGVDDSFGYQLQRQQYFCPASDFYYCLTFY